MRKVLLAALRSLAITEQDTKKFISDHNGRPTQDDLNKYVKDQGMDKDEIAEIMYDLVKNQVGGLEAPEPAPKESKPSIDDDDMLQAYLAAALWSSTDGDKPLDEDYDIDDFSAEAIKEATKDVNDFRSKAADLLDSLSLIKDGEGSDIGHDFWLTRNGHGAGFWDGDYEDRDGNNIGEALTEISKTFKEIDPYPGDDGQLYF